jgi:tetratricopeptide (TPR) repeat protein
MPLRLFFASCCIFLLQSASAQVLTPAEIMQVMDTSSVAYNLMADKHPLKPAPIPHDDLVAHGLLPDRRPEGNPKPSEPSAAAFRLINQAEERFSIKAYTQARNLYLEALRADSNYAPVITHIGQTYEEEGLLDQAITWYKRAIQKNSADYMAHWFLADAMMEQNQKDLALKHILRAHVLNRNNPRILNAMKEIFRVNKIPYSEWTFSPVLELTPKGKKAIDIKADPVWLGYALAKAVWAMEPSVRNGIGSCGPVGQFCLPEEQSALMGLLAMSESKDAKNTPPCAELRALKLALDKKLIDAYIIYEIILPRIPAYAYQCSEELLAETEAYVKVRGR